MKILVVEDDTAFAALVEAALTAQHYQVDVVTDAQAGWNWLETYEYDLILLDLVLPGEADGLCFCRELRARGNLTPVLLMTANEAQSVKVQGLDAGADDYLVKPFDWEELQARLRALLRRGHDALSPQLVWGELRLDPSSCEVACQGRLLSLTAKEYNLLELLLRHPQRIFSAGALLDRLWDSSDIPSENAVRAHIKGLRRKLKTAGVGEMIETVYGLGYRLRPAPPRQAPAVAAAPPESSRPAAELQAQLAGVWQRARQTYLEQVATLDRLLGQSTHSRLSPEDWKQVCRQAHSLKGGLGSFGLHGAAAVAEQVHNLVDPLPKMGLACSLGQPHSAELHRLLGQLHQALEATTTIQLPPLSKRLEPTPGSLAGPLLDPDHPRDRCWLVTADPDLHQRLAIAFAGRVDLVLLGEDSDPTQNEPARPKPNPETNTAVSPLLLVDLADPAALGLAALQTQPWIALTPGNSLAQRLQAWQQGCRCCLDRQSNGPEILAAVLQQAQRLRQTELRAIKLLLVDDDPALLALLGNRLRAWDIALTALEQPTQFWQVLEQTAPDVLILDMEMPGFNGLDLCRVVRQDPRWCQLPILFLSAHGGGPLLEQLFAAGADDFVAKPASPEVLMARVSQCLARRRSSPGQIAVDALPSPRPPS